MNRTTLLARMKKLAIDPKLSPYLAIRIAATRLRWRNTLAISSMPADSKYPSINIIDC